MQDALASDIMNTDNHDTGTRPPDRASDAIGPRGAGALDELWTAVERAMGVCPSFFRLATPDPDIAEGLFGFARLAYLDSPMPAALKEKLFTYLSRFCPVRYCVARHAAFLLGHGHVAGDASEPPLTPAEVLAVLEEPLPEREELVATLAELRLAPAPLEDWPEFDSEPGKRFRVACAKVFLEPHRSEAWCRELERLLGPRRYTQLTLFLLFVRAAHFWTEVHPELGLEPDVEALLREHERLVEPLLERKDDAERAALGAILQGELAELRELSAALRESEARFRLMADAAPVLIWISDTAKQCTWFNRQWLDFVGRTMEEELGYGWTENVHPDDMARCVEIYTTAFDRRQPFTMDYRLRRHDGEYRWMLDHGVPLYHEGDREFRGYIGSCIDVTERRKAEVALQRRNRQQEAVARLGEQALRERDLQALFDAATAAVARTLEVEYCKVLELLPGGDQVLLRAGVGWREGLVGVGTVDTGLNSQAGYTLRSDEPVVVEDLREESRFNGPPLLRDHGVVSGMSCIIRGVAGKPWGVLGTHTTRRVRFTVDDVNFLVAVANVLGDAIERERSEWELRGSEERFRTLADNISQLAWMKDETGWTFWYNRRWFEYTGTTLEEMQGWGWKAVHHPDHLDRVVEHFQHALDAGEPWEDLFPLRGKDGEYRWFLSRAVPIRDAEGNIERWFGTNTDVTEQREAQEALRESEGRQRELSTRLKLLLETTSRLIESLQKDELLATVLDVSREIVAADAFAVWRVDDEDVWSVVSARGLSEEFVRDAIPSGSAAELPNEPVVVQPEDLADRSLPLLSERWARYDREGIRSLVVLPLKIHGTVAGTLVFYAREPHRFTEFEIESGRALANVAAAAITTSELYAEQSRLRRRAEEAAIREAFLAAAGAILSESLDYEQTLSNVARAAVPQFADWCAVDLLDDEGELRRLAVAHADPDRVALARELHERYPPDPDADRGIWHVVRTGEPDMVSEIPDDLLVRAARDEEHLRILRELKLKSYVCVPLHAGGTVRGALTFLGTESGRRFDDRDLAVARELGRRASQAIEQALLYRQTEKSESRFRQIAETIREVFYVAERDGVQYVSPAYESVWGRSVRTLYDDARSFLESVVPEDRATVEEALDRQWRGEDTDLEYRIARPDGEVRWVRDRAFPITDARGVVVRIVGDVEDVTARREAEQAAERRARQQRAVARLGELALRERDLQTVFDHATSLVGETLEVEYCKVLELLPDGERVLLKAGVGWREGLVGRATVGTDLDSQAGYTLLAGAPVVVEDFREETRFRGPPLLREHGVVSGASCIILAPGGSSWGVLGAHTTRRVDFTPDDVGFLVAVANILGDAIHRDQAEQQLRESEERSRRAQTAGGVGVWEFDPRTEHTVWSEAMWDIYGLPCDRDDDCGELFRSSLHPDDADAFWRKRQAALAGEAEEFEADFRIVRPDGAVRWVQAIAEIERDADGRATRMAGVNIDVTERVGVHQALAERERQFRSTFENAAVGMAHVGLDGRWLRVNDRLREIVGYSHEELRERNFQDLTHPDDVRSDLDLLDALVRGDLPGYRMEKRYYHRDGHVVWVHLTVSLQRDEHGEPAYCIAVIEDVSARKQAEDALVELNRTLEERVEERTATLSRQRERLRRLAHQLTTAEERERKQLAYAVHEGLQQMIVAATMQVQSARAAGGEEELEKLERLLGLILQESRSLTHSLTPPVLYDSDLRHALEWLARWFDEFAEFRVLLDVASGFPELEENEKFFLFGVVRELLMNAVKHAGVDEAHVRLDADDERIAIEVWDEGRGFDPATIDADRDLASFGLFSIRERLGALDGTFDVESAPGQGARFRLQLPLSRRHASDESLPSEPTETSQARRSEVEVKPVRVLLVDDHEMVRKGFAMILSRRNGLQIVGEAANGLEAVELSDRLRPDVILMDVSMPEMDGVEATKRIKEKHPEQHVVGVSMHQDRDMADRMRSAGASDYVCKDDAASTLYDTVRSLCERAADDD